MRVDAAEQFAAPLSWNVKALLKRSLSPWLSRSLDIRTNSQSIERFSDHHRSAGPAITIYWRPRR